MTQKSTTAGSAGRIGRSSPATPPTSGVTQEDMDRMERTFMEGVRNEFSPLTPEEEARQPEIRRLIAIEEKERTNALRRGLKEPL